MKKYLRSKNAIKDGSKTQLSRARKSVYKLEKLKRFCDAFTTRIVPAMIDALKAMVRTMNDLPPSVYGNRRIKE